MTDYKLKSLIEEAQVPAIPTITPDEPFKMKRVTRPLRNILYVPTKQLLFFSKNKEPQFSYDIRFPLPLKDVGTWQALASTKNVGPARSDSKKIVVQVKTAALNPVDLQIINSYTSNLNYERGIGREYAGIITDVGEKYDGPFHVGDEVCGLYWHPNSYGTLSSSIMIDPAVDPFVKKPSSISWEEAGSWMVSFGTAWQVLQKAQVSEKSTVLINGGSTGVGLMALQLLKQYYKAANVVVICSDKCIELVKNRGADIVIDYTVNRDIPFVLKKLTTSGVYTEKDQNGDNVDVIMPPKKFDLIIDCVGGEELVYKSADYLEPRSTGAKFITTVGDVKFNHRKDMFNEWNSRNANARAAFGLLWGMNYSKVYFYPYNDIPAAGGNWMSVGAEMLNTGEIVNVIDSVFDWKEYAEAKEKLQRGHCHGKVVLQVEQF